jgi:CCR4-NOT complex subunit CAF16
MRSVGSAAGGERATCHVAPFALPAPMPVPVSVTGFAGGESANVASEELQTQGPFARLSGAADAVPPVHAGPAAPSAPVVDSSRVLHVQHLTFQYCGLDGHPVEGSAPVIRDASFSLAAGSRVLLLGENGCGKSTLLRVLAGKCLVARDAVSVCGQSPFHDTGLISDGVLAFVGGSWQKEVAFAGYSVPLSGDFQAARMLDSVPCSPQRRAALYKALDVDPTWRMHTVSDGQRRRVQLAYGLLRPYTVLLLDEVTVDLDVLGRAEFCAFVRQDCEQRGAVVVYATHIFDGLAGWATHIAFLEQGQLTVSKAEQVLAPGQRLLPTFEQWLRGAKARRMAAKRDCPPVEAKPAVLRNNGWGEGRMMPTRDMRNEATAALGS